MDKFTTLTAVSPSNVAGTGREMERLSLTSKGVPFKVSDDVDMKAWRPPLLR